MSDFYFDDKAADKAVKFIEVFCSHVKGELAGKPFELESWQKDTIIKPLFGWKRSNGLRKYRTAYIEIPRKNGKSNLCAGIGLYLLFMDGEKGAEVYSAAGDRKQAGIVFDIARHMVLNNPSLNSRSTVFRDSIMRKEDFSFYMAISADADTKHGFNAHGIVFDELHTQPNRELWDVLTTSTGARTQPLTVAITTAGYDRNSICYEMHDYAIKVREGIIKDDSFLPVIYAADIDDDIMSEETWKKANPGYGTIVKKDYLKEQAEKARKQPTYENTFRRLHLNQWTSSEIRWISDENWMKCLEEEPDLNGLECSGGLDLASTRDISALCFKFKLGEEKSYFKWFFWVPEENAVEKEKSDRAPYLTWARQGFIRLTPGDVTDYNFIKKDILDFCKKHKVKEIAYDPWNSSQLVIDLTEEGVNMVEFVQGFRNISFPTKDFDRQVHQQNISHNGNPVARWMLSNVMLKMDENENVKIDKKKSRDKVDGMVAAVMAHGLTITFSEKPQKSIYEERGPIIL